MSPPTSRLKNRYVEDLDEYQSGGFHPIHIGDSLGHERYTIAQKLGKGGVSTVWLAHDKQEECDVTLSVILSKGPRGSLETQTSTAARLKAGPDDHPGKRNVLIPLRTFELFGPNGSHTCFTSPVMGQSISIATKRAQGTATRTLPLSCANTAILDLMTAISYMAACGIVHGDLHPGNLLLSLDDNVDGTTGKSILDHIGPPRIMAIDQAANSTLSKAMPTYLVEAALEHDLDTNMYSGHLKVADFGDSFQETEPPQLTSDIGPYLLPEYASNKKSASGCVASWLHNLSNYQRTRSIR